LVCVVVAKSSADCRLTPNGKTVFSGFPPTRQQPLLTSTENRIEFVAWQTRPKCSRVYVRQKVSNMWNKFFEFFFGSLIGAGVVSFFWWRRRPDSMRLSVMILNVVMVVLVISVPQIVLGYFPRLDEGWIRYAVCFAVAGVITLPFSFLAQRLRPKKGDDA
jgi:hypothetical protein